MGNPKLGKSKNGQAMHFSVGALIEMNGKFLLIDRANIPFGFAGIAGHIDEDETIIESLIKEVKEECGLKVINHALLFEEEVDWNFCSKGINVHYWYLFRCKVSGTIKKKYREFKSIRWYTKEEIEQLDKQGKLEPIWKYWFEKLGIIPKKEIK